MTLDERLADLVGLLQGTGYSVIDHVDENPYPPVIMISGADPFIEASDTLNNNERFCRFTVICTVETGTNLFMSSNIVEMVTKVLINLNGSDWEIEVVPAPTMLQSNEGYYLGCLIQVKSEFELE